MKRFSLKLFSFAPYICFAFRNVDLWGQTAVTTIVSNGTVQFDPSDSAVCYAVVIDNTSNDGRFVMASEYRP